jgi:hypothetical protein
MRSRCDVERDHLPYASIKSRTVYLILNKFSVGGESYEILLNHFSFHLDRTILTTTLHKDFFQLISNT